MCLLFSKANETIWKLKSPLDTKINHFHVPYFAIYSFLLLSPFLPEELKGQVWSSNSDKIFHEPFHSIKFFEQFLMKEKIKKNRNRKKMREISRVEEIRREMVINSTGTSFHPKTLFHRPYSNPDSSLTFDSLPLNIWFSFIFFSGL